MGGMATWQVKIESNIKSVIADIERLEKQKHELKLNINTDELDKAMKNLNKMLDSLGKGSGDFKQFENMAQQLADITSSVQNLSKAFGVIDNNNNFQTMIQSINGINTSLESMRAIISDVGDGQEFSPLLQTINEVTSAVGALSKTVDKIKLNINLDTSVNEDQVLMKIEGRKQDLLRAYQEQFAAMKAYKIDHSKVISSMMAAGNNANMSHLNKSILTFDDSIYDNIDQKIKAYESIIKRMQEVQKAYYGNDVYDGMDKSYQKAVTTAKSNLTRAQNALGKGSTEEISNLFGGTDINLSGLSTEIDKIVGKLQEMIDLFQSVFETKVDFNTEEASAELINLSEVLNQIKQAITDINAITIETKVSGEDGSSSSSTAVNEEVSAMEKLETTTEQAVQVKKDLERQASKKNSSDQTLVIESVNKAKRELIKTEEEYQSLKAKESSNSATDEEIAKLEELTQKRKQANDVINADAINKTAEAMHKLKASNTGEMFGDAFTNASAKIEELNNKLQNGDLSLEDYNAGIKKIKDSLNAIGKTDTMLTNFQEHIGDSEMLTNALEKAREKAAELNTTLQNGGSLYNYNQGVQDIEKQLNAIRNANAMLANFQTSIGGDANLSTAFTNASAKVEELNGKLQNGTLSVKAYNKEITNIQKSLAASKDAIKFIAPNDIAAGEEALKTYALQVSNNKAKLEEMKVANGKVTATWIDQNGAVQQLTGYYDSLTGALTVTQQQLGQSAKKAKTLNEIFKQGWKNVIQYAASFASFYKIISLIKNGITVIKELDTALTEMRKVSDESVSSLKNFQKVSFDIANSVGTTAKQIQNSTADWMRLGESLEEASKSAEISNILLNVSEFESIDDATESLVAMSSAYDELDKMSIIDKLNEVGNNYSISTDELATALQKSASALTTAGNDMDEAVALITAGDEQNCLKSMETYFYRTHLIARIA